MTQTRLTPEDVAWLEARLGEAAAPVAPNADYVKRTKAAVLEGKVEDHEANMLAAAFVVTAITAGLAGLVAATVHLLARRRARQ